MKNRKTKPENPEGRLIPGFGFEKVQANPGLQKLVNNMGLFS